MMQSLGSSGSLMPSDPFAPLGAFLTATEAQRLAAQFEAGQLTTHALREVNPSRREEAKQLVAAAGLGHAEAALSAAVLRSIAGAKLIQHDLTPVWTMPGNEATTGHLTSEFHRLVQGARESVTCATYNFETTSKMWTVLKEVSEQPGVIVTLYVDGDKADTSKLKAQLPKANVFRSGELPNGQQVVSHAKFIIVDHSVVLLTSANFSFSGENKNIELGLIVHDSGLALSLEQTMESKQSSLYQLL
jgi:phosphatidylserine/phosphatidylglycerophosphate/cardiolipin synthase-like enzyme